MLAGTEKGHRRRRLWMIIGALIGCVAPLLTFPSRRGGMAYILDIEVALPWAAGLSLLGAILVLWSCWLLPRRTTGGATVSMIVATVTLLSMPLIGIRLDWKFSAADVLCLLGLLGAVAVLSTSAVQCARKPS